MERIDIEIFDVQVVVLSALIRERTQSVNTAIGCGILIDILRKSLNDEGKCSAAECLARLAHLKSGKYYF
jgi:hypothetical protein